MKKNDGGPAFPLVTGYSKRVDGGGYETLLAQELNRGMSLRDYFAGKALQGFCANPAVFTANGMCGWSLVNTNEKGLVSYTLHIADSILAERGNGPAVNAELLAALKSSEELHAQMRGYLQSISSGELGLVDADAYIRNRGHESEAVSAISRAAIAKASA